MKRHLGSARGLLGLLRICFVICCCINGVLSFTTTTKTKPSKLSSTTERRKSPFPTIASRKSSITPLNASPRNAVLSKIPRNISSLLNPSTTVSPATNLLLVVLAAALLVGYHVNLYYIENNKNIKTWRQYQADAREDWSRHVRATQGWLYAIQSLRNAITAQTFLASTVLSLLTLITGRIWDILRSLPQHHHHHHHAASTILFFHNNERQLLTLQLASIAATMLFSAYQFLQGVRLMTHAGFMFPVKQNSTKVDKIMRQTQNCQWLGLRGMYLSLAPIAWVVGGSRGLGGAAVLLWIFFQRMDQKPEGLGYEEFQGGNI